MGCNHGGRGCEGAKACHMLSGQPRSPLEDGDMGKRGSPEWRLDTALRCLQSKHYCLTKAEMYHTSGSKQLVSEPPIVLLPPPSFFSKNIKGLLTNCGHRQAREFQILTRSVLPRPVWPSRAGWEHHSMGAIARTCGRAVGCWQSVPSSAFANSLGRNNQKHLLLLPPH